MTRNRPQIETSNKPVIRRFRGPTEQKEYNKQTKDSSYSRPPLVIISTQAEEPENIENVREPVQAQLHPRFISFKQPPTINARLPQTLFKVFGEEFLAEATKQDRSLTPLMKLIKDKDWESLKTNKYFYSLRKDLAETESGCIQYDNKLLIPRRLKQLVIDAIHQTHPGQAGMLRLGI